jgi:hypothetical protein
VQCTRTITLFRVIIKLLPFVTFPLLFFLSRALLEKLPVGIQYNFIQWSSILRGSAVQRNHNYFLTHLIVFCPLLLFIVQCITWKFMVGIQRNFIQWSRAVRWSAVQKNHNSIWNNYSNCPLLLLCLLHN